MPVRIKPIQQFKPCVITLGSLKEIIDLIDNEFDTVTLTATDGIWEIFDESKAAFINEVEKRDTLDSFSVFGQSSQDQSNIEIVFNESCAYAKLTAQPNKDRWFQHFLYDIQKHLLRATFAQIVIHSFNMPDVYFRIPFFLFTVPVRFNNLSVNYSNIVIKKKPPNPFLENVKANLVSSLIWLALTVFFTLLIQWILSNFGIDLTPWD